jgi:hypothetical protein
MLIIDLRQTPHQEWPEAHAIGVQDAREIEFLSGCGILKPMASAKGGFPSLSRRKQTSIPVATAPLRRRP